MSIKCLINGLEVNYPCSPVCALFGDCVTAFAAKKKKNVRTNADRIRAMSDEELADFIDRCEMSDIDYSKTFCNLCNGQYECSQCRLEWLKQPAEEE